MTCTSSWMSAPTASPLSSLFNQSALAVTRVPLVAATPFPGRIATLKWRVGSIRKHAGGVAAAGAGAVKLDDMHLLVDERSNRFTFEFSFQPIRVGRDPGPGQRGLV